MRALVLTYETDAGPGVFAEAMRSRGVELDTWLVPSAAAPADPASYDAVMSLGGSMHTEQEGDHPWLRDQRSLLARLVEREVPLLGVCLGAQLLGEAVGAPAERLAEPRIGWYEIEVTPEGEADPLLGALAPSFEGFEWHSFAVPTPPGAVALARSPGCLQAFRVGESAWGIQFHAEVTRGDLESWIATYGRDGDTTRPGMSPDDLRRDADERMQAWNELGRGFCGRFVDVAARFADLAAS